MQNSNLPYTPNDVELIVVHDAISADVALAAAEKIPCHGAKGIMLEFSADVDIANRQCDFTVYVSNDGSTFEQYNMLISNVTNTQSQTLTRVATLNQAAASAVDVQWFTPETLGGITHFKVVANVTDAASPAGTFTVKASITR